MAIYKSDCFLEHRYVFSLQSLSITESLAIYRCKLQTSSITNFTKHFTFFKYCWGPIITPLTYKHYLNLVTTCKCFVLTQDINEEGWRVDLSIFILRLAVIMPSILWADGREMVTSPWCLKQVLLVPGVISCWVSITATGQIHWTSLHYFTRGAHWHRGKLGSILGIVWIERHLMLEYTIRKRFCLGSIYSICLEYGKKGMVQHCSAWQMLSLSTDTNYIQLLLQNMCNV